jgi:hypothetical protein
MEDPVVNLADVLRLHVVHHLDAQSRKNCRLACRELRLITDTNHDRVKLTSSQVNELVQGTSTQLRPKSLVLHDCNDDQVQALWRLEFARQALDGKHACMQHAMLHSMQGLHALARGDVQRNMWRGVFAVSCAVA